MKLTTIFHAILCVLRGWGLSSKSTSATVSDLYLFQCAVCNSLWVDLGHEMLSDTASLRLQDWVTPGSLLLSRMAISVILPAVGQLS